MQDSDPTPEPASHTFNLSSLFVYTPILICLLVMLPRLISPQFGLLDDGNSIHVADSLLRGKLDLSWDIQAGRARPVYWAAFIFWYLLVGGHPFWYFFGSLLVFSATTWMIIRLVCTLGGTKWQAWASGLLYCLCPPVIENAYTLSKAENFQLLLLVSSIYLVVQSAKAGGGGTTRLRMVGAGILSLAAYLTKESTLMMIPVTLGWWLIAWIGQRRHHPSAPLAQKITLRLLVISVVNGVIFYIVRSVMISTRLLGVGQSSDFNFDPANMLNGLIRWGGWLLRDFTWLGLLICLALLVYALKRRLPGSPLWLFALVWMVIWLGLYIPWRFAVEYYLLPFTAGAAVLGGILLGEIPILIKNSPRLGQGAGFACLGVVLLVLAATQANSYSDATVQLAQDRVNTAVMEYVTRQAPQDSQVLVNIQLSNEYIEQMKLLLKDYYQRPDLQLTNYTGQDLAQLASGQSAVLMLVAQLENQPRMTVRMGLEQDSLQEWDASLLPHLAGWDKVFTVLQNPRLLTVDFPRLLCKVIYRENYCSSEGGLVNDGRLVYEWTVYQEP